MSKNVQKVFWVDTWFERDRAMVILYYGIEKDPNNSTLVYECWDEEVSEMVENGFLDSRNWLASMLSYTRTIKLSTIVRIDAKVRTF